MLGMTGPAWAQAMWGQGGELGESEQNKNKKPGWFSLHQVVSR